MFPQNSAFIAENSSLDFKHKKSRLEGGFFVLDLSEFDEFVIVGSETEFKGGFDGVNTVSAFDSFKKMVAAGVIGCGINKVDAGFVNGDGVKAAKNSDVFHAGIFGDCAAVAVNGHVFHNVDVSCFSAEIFYNGGSGISHGFKEGIMV